MFKKIFGGLCVLAFLLCVLLVQASYGDIINLFIPCAAILGTIGLMIVDLPRFQIRGLAPVAHDSKLYANVQELYHDVTGTPGELTVLEDPAGQFGYKAVVYNGKNYLLVNKNNCKANAALLLHAQRIAPVALEQEIATAGQGESTLEQYSICIQCAHIALRNPQRFVHADIIIATLEVAAYAAIFAIVNLIAGQFGVWPRIGMALLGYVIAELEIEALAGRLIHRPATRAALQMTLEYAHQKERLAVWANVMITFFKPFDGPKPFSAQLENSKALATSLPAHELIDLIEAFVKSHS